MKKWILILVLISSFSLIFLINQVETIKGDGTKDNPYQIKDAITIEKIELEFQESYPSLFMESDMICEEQLYQVWETTNTSDANIQIQKVQYYGQDALIDYEIKYLFYPMFDYIKFDANKRAKDETIILTSSYYSLIDPFTQTSKYNQRYQGDNFTSVLSEIYDELGGFFVVDYLINFEEQWYFMSSMMKLENGQKVPVPIESGKFVELSE